MHPGLINGQIEVSRCPENMVCNLSNTFNPKQAGFAGTPVLGDRRLVGFCSEPDAMYKDLMAGDHCFADF